MADRRGRPLDALNDSAVRDHADAMVVTPDHVAVGLLARGGHVHVATTADGWHCFTVTIHGPEPEDIEVICGDGATIAAALDTVRPRRNPTKAPRTAVRCGIRVRRAR